METAGAPELTRLSGAEAASRGGRGGGPEASAQRRCPRPLLLASLPVLTRVARVCMSHWTEHSTCVKHVCVI